MLQATQISLAPNDFSISRGLKLTLTAMSAGCIVRMISCFEEIETRIKTLP